MSKATLPTPETNPGKAEWSEVYANDKALRDVINGQLDTENLKSGAGITDGQLASPNNLVYRTFESAQVIHAQGLVAGSYLLVNGGSNGAQSQSGANLRAGSYNVHVFPIVSTDIAVPSKTSKLRLRAQALCNATKAALKYTFGLYPVSVGGGANELTLTLGTVVAGSTVEINEPPAATATPAAGSDFAVPSDGVYALGVVTSGTLTTNSAILLSAQLQMRFV